MANCNVGHGCSTSCTGGCGCAYVHAEKRCVCFCSGDSVKGGGVRFNTGAKIDISVSNLPLWHVAAHLDGILKREVLVPAARAQKPVVVRLKGVSISAALKALGLATRKRIGKSKA